LIKKIFIGYSALFFLAIAAVYAQDAPEAAVPDDGGTAAPQALPVKFRGFELAMGIDELKTNLAADPYFAFRGDRDVSFLPLARQNLVESAGNGFIRRAFFQLKDDTVFIMSFSLDTERIDHYSVYTAFVEKYGEPRSLSPREAVWETESTRISIERPLTVKYIDRAVFDTLVEQSGAARAHQDELRDDFINDF
jgi:hypothetical protein